MSSTNPFALTGVIHLPPTPGYRNSPGLDRLIEFALEEATTLERAGFSGILIENEGDRPHKLQVSEEYVESFALLVNAVKSRTSLPVGLEILYDMIGTVQAGILAKADFVRLDVFTDDTEVTWGRVRACTQEVALLRSQHADSFPRIWADIHVKHGRNLSGRSLAESTRLATRHGADVLIVTGTVTGEPPSLIDCEEIRANSGGLPLFVGSGFSEANAGLLSGACNGAVLATAIQIEGRLDFGLCEKLARAVRSMQELQT